MGYHLASSAFQVPFECRNEGQTHCISCTDLITCKSLGDGTYLEYPSNCSKENMTCMNGRCTTADNHACSDRVTMFRFECTQPGIFLDPYDCAKFHICTPDEHFERQCADGWYFNQKTGSCSYKSETDICKMPICDEIGQAGPVPDNPNLYFVCMVDDELVLSPRIYACPGDAVFDKELKTCASLPPARQGIVGGKCTIEGKFCTGECNSYYECELDQPPSRRNCPAGEYFDHVKEDCAKFCSDI